LCRELLNSLEEMPVRAQTQAPPRAPAEMPREAERSLYK
jgi:hypothetical protein